MENLSIHPRNWQGAFGFAQREKKNTCEPLKLRSTVQRAYDGITKHLMDHPKDAMATVRANTLKEILKGKLR